MVHAIIVVKSATSSLNIKHNDEMNQKSSTEEIKSRVFELQLDIKSRAAGKSQSLLM